MAEILDAFDAIVRAHADAVAIVAGDGTLTFAALAERIDRLADRLRQRGVARGDVLALSLGRSAAHVCGMLASWRAGAAFLAIDDAAPAERVRAMLDESRARARLTADAADVRIETLAADPRPLGAAEDDLAYVVYTSGSTGRPKGVRVSHRALVPTLRQQVRAFGLAPGKRALLCLSTAFDASISDIGTALLAGATLVIPAEVPSPAELVERLRVHAITHADVPPAFLPRIDPRRLPPTLETIVIGGEVCPPDAVRAWARRARVVNVYGPTEATICTSLCACDPDRWTRPLIGDPLDHVAYDVEGDELLIGGPALALGYVDRPELEAERFVTRDGERWYRTGDRVRRLDDGAIEFVGRLDRQIKLRGQLVCPEEIEACLRAMEDVADATVIAERVEAGGAARVALTAFVVLRSEARASAATLRDRLAGALPRWMLPRVVITDSVERRSTGKVDRGSLRRRATSGVSDLRVRAIADAFAEVLDVAGVEADDDFASLGGDSLAAVEVAARAALAGVAVAPSTVLRARTPALVARAPGERGRSVAELDAIASRLAREIGDDASADPDDTAWLVTGATGFLGRRLLPELLARTSARVHCVVRAGTREEARARLGPAADDPRVVPHAGDVAAPFFALPRGEWRELARSVSRVIHAAASLSLALPFEALETVNVRAALEVARFVRGGARKRLFHVSTLATLASTDLADEMLDERTTLGLQVVLHGAYGQTKWTAEALFRASVPELTIVRPGLLTGDSRSGAGATRCVLRGFLAALATLGCVPRASFEPLRVDVTPIDHAARAIATIATAPAHAPVVHVASEHGASLAELLDALRLRVRVDDVARDDFLRAARERLPRDAALALVGSAFRLLGTDAHRSADLFLHTGRRFPCRVLESITGEPAPAPDRGLLARYVADACGGAP